MDIHMGPRGFLEQGEVAAHFSEAVEEAAGECGDISIDLHHGVITAPQFISLPGLR
jgi:hypothetical protein